MAITKKKSTDNTAKVVTERRPVGRPLTYTDDVPGRLIDYFDRDVDEYVKHNFTTAGKSNYRVLPPPTLVGFCREIGVSVVTLHRWMDKDSGLSGEQRQELCNAYAQAKKLQENIVAAIGMLTNGSFAAFFLKCNHGWRETAELQLNTDKPIRLNIVSQRPQDTRTDEEKAAVVDWGDD